MYKMVFMPLLILFLLSGCQESQTQEYTQYKRNIIIKNSFKKYTQKSVEIVVGGKSGDKLYANSRLVKEFNRTEDAKVLISLDGEDGLKSILLELEDKDGNFAKDLTLQVYKDTTPPTIELKGNKEYEILAGTKFVDPGINVEDNIDKNVTIKTIGSIKSNIPGDYTIKYIAIDDANNSTKITRLVVVKDAKSYNFAPEALKSTTQLEYLDGQNITLDLNSYFKDRNGDKLKYSIEGLPKFLTLLESGVVSGKISSSASQKSPYNLKITAVDSGGKSAFLNLQIKVKNSAPVAKDDSVKVDVNKTVIIDVLKNDSDSDGDAFEIAGIMSSSKHGRVQIVGNKIKYTPNNNFTGVDGFEYSIEDSDGARVTAKVTINVKKFKNIPIVYLSQDTWDRDNYSLIAAAKKMHLRELIDLRAVDVTGRDLDGKVSNVFRAILGNDVDIPVLINHSFYGRATPTTRNFPQLGRYISQTISDRDALDSTDYILSDLESIDTSREVVYVAGGHLHNFASLLLQDANLVNEKVDRIVISTGWEDRVSGKPEMNLSEGVYKETSTSKATQIVFSKFKGEIIMASDPDANYPVLDTSKMDRTSALWYFISHGEYNDKQLHIGDFEALLYGAVEDSWYGHHWVDKKEARCSVTNYGAVKLSGSGAKCFYLDNMNSYYTKAVLEELLYRED